MLSYSDLLDAQRADARTLVTLLHLRDIEARRGEAFTIVSEMLDVRNRDLAHVTSADDFIVSNRLVSLAMSQLAENPGLRAVFNDLFDEEGSEVYLKPAGDYVVLGAPVDFYTVLELARRRSEVAIGYRLIALSEDSDQELRRRAQPRQNAGDRSSRSTTRSSFSPRASARLQLRTSTPTGGRRTSVTTVTKTQKPGRAAARRRRAGSISRRRPARPVRELSGSGRGQGWRRHERARA